jgi:hypothetical protein
MFFVSWAFVAIDIEQCLKLRLNFTCCLDIDQIQAKEAQTAYLQVLLPTLPLQVRFLHRKPFLYKRPDIVPIYPWIVCFSSLPVHRIIQISQSHLPAW